jgi:hypothetical protein
MRANGAAGSLAAGAVGVCFRSVAEMYVWRGDANDPDRKQSIIKLLLRRPSIADQFTGLF